MSSLKPRQQQAMTGFGTDASVTAAMAVHRIEKDVQQQVR